MTRARRYVVRVAGVALAGTLPLAAVTPAASAARPEAVASFVMAPPAFTFSGAKPPVVEDSSFAGYETTEGGYKSIVANLTVPSILKCGAKADSGMGPVVIIAGSDYFVGAGAEASCYKGATTYEIAVNYNGSENKYLTVKPKDEIHVVITVTKSKTTVDITDETTKQTASRTVASGSVSVAEMGDDSLVNSETDVQLPIPPFSHHRFSGCTINKVALGKAKSLADEELVKGKTVLIVAGVLKAKGKAFVMYFKKAS